MIPSAFHRFSESRAALPQGRGFDPVQMFVVSRDRFLGSGFAKSRWVESPLARIVLALARARSAAWPRSMALSGLASVALAAGDEVGARAILEETLQFGGGVGYVGIDSVCGALALLLGKAGERDRALRVLGAASPMVSETICTAVTGSQLNGLGRSDDSVSAMVDLRTTRTHQIYAWLRSLNTLRVVMEAA